MNPHRADRRHPAKLRHATERIFLPGFGKGETDRTLEVRAIDNAFEVPSPAEAEVFADLSGEVVGGMFPHRVLVALEEGQIVGEAKVVPRASRLGVRDFCARLCAAFGVEGGLFGKGAGAAGDLERVAFRR